MNRPEATAAPRVEAAAARAAKVVKAVTAVLADQPALPNPPSVRFAVNPGRTTRTNAGVSCRRLAKKNSRRLTPVEEVAVIGDERPVVGVSAEIRSSQPSRVWRLEMHSAI